jgi:hypothetical protein
MDQESEMHNMLHTIKTREDFENFLEILVSDYKEHKEEWENDTLKSYLEALHGYNYNSNNDRPSWKAFAEMLVAARFYE